MKSESSNSVEANPGSQTEPSNSAELSNASVPLGPIETAKEAKEKDHSKSGTSWIKNIGSGMRTLRLRKHGDKKDKSSNHSSILDPEHELSVTTTTPIPPPVSSIPPSPSPNLSSN